MKAVKISGVLLACVAFLVSAAAGADNGKIGIIDFQEVLADSEAGRKVQQQMRAEGQGMEGELQELAADIEELDKQLSRDSMVMNEQKREEKQQELEKKQYEFQSRRQQYQGRFRELESELVGKLEDEVFSIAEEIGKEQGYRLIIERSAAVYYPDSIDLTSEVIKLYDERHGDDIPGEGGNQD
ncbi:MAG: OmpH family outer membrane protein [Desulfobacterales bacterium]